MIAAPTTKNKRDPRQKYPIPVRRAAAILGYTPAHVSRVIRGLRVSPPTLRRYQELVAKEAGK